VVVGIPEPTRSSAYVFYDSVDALGPRVRQPSFQEPQRFRPPGLDRAGETVDFGDVGVGAPRLEVVQPAADDVRGGVLPGTGQHASQVLLSLNRPSADDTPTPPCGPVTEPIEG
jgi:hypothetical protein